MAELTALIRRLCLASLLALLLVGLAVHLILPVSGIHHAVRETACAIHAGMIRPDVLQSLQYESAVAIGVVQDRTNALCLATKIPHPPTI
jgi:hypothetical protein